MRKLIFSSLFLASVTISAGESLQLKCKDYSFFHSLVTKETVSLQKSPLLIPKTAGSYPKNRSILAENETNRFWLFHDEPNIITVALVKKSKPNEFEVLSSADFKLVVGNIVSVDFNADDIQARLNCIITK